MFDLDVAWPKTEVTLMRRVAMITGASRGIGAATALLLAERGFRVVVNHHASAPQAEEVVAAIAKAGGEAVAIQADVTAPDDVARMVGEIDERWDSVDVVVHNALIPFAITSFAELTWEQLGGKLDRELRAAFLITKAVVPRMISRNYGRLIYLSTGLSRRPREGMITLGAAKAALDQFVRFIAPPTPMKSGKSGQPLYGFIVGARSARAASGGSTSPAPNGRRECA
jgi:NAD(P)-dependent dehydrogenase (short-subunit alcohol dehydrogenase family)